VFALAAANQVKVMLDGQGADEQLAGYPNYFAPRFGSLLRGRCWGTFARELRTTARIHGRSLGWGARYALNNVLPERLRQPARRLAGQSGTKPAWLRMDRLGAEPRDPFLATGAARARSVRDMSYSQLTAASLPMLLHWEDRDSMAHSVEARVPFLDYRVVELVLGLPDEYKIADGMTKRVLREAMRGVIPERVRTRVDKLGFVTPEEVWLREENPDQFRVALAEAVEASSGVLKRNIMDKLERVIAGQDPFTFLPWRCISFGSWLKVFGVRA
jgi:asparagine synthase (glutamine-hydrolysing)